MIRGNEWKEEYIRAVRDFMDVVLEEEPYWWSDEEGVWERGFFADREKYPEVALDVRKMRGMLLDKSGWYDNQEVADEAAEPYFDKYHEGSEQRGIQEYSYHGPNSKPWDYHYFWEYQCCVDKGLIINPMTKEEFAGLVRKLDNLPDDEQLSEDDLDRYCRRK